MPSKIYRFWQIIMKRKFIYLIVVYVAVAFAIFEIINVIVEPTNADKWSPLLVLVILLAGLPLVIIIFWLYNITSKKAKRTRRADADGQTIKFENSIAVLPFQDISPARDQEYFCDGIAEEIITALAHVSSLKVIARSSAFAFKNQNLDLREIGQRLNVGALLDGSIQKDGNRLRISAQLINTEDGSYLWSERFDRNLEDIFAIQDEISLAVVNNLKIKLLGNERSTVLKHYTHDFEVYNLYLKALSNIQLATSGGFEKAIDYIQQVLKTDPLFVPGYHGLAEIYILSSFFGKMPPNTAYPKAKEYAEKTLEIDDKYSDAHRILGVVSTYFDWDWEAAERHFKYAMELNPSNEWVHYSYANYLTFMGRHAEAVVEAKQAVELDPLSGYFSAMLGNTYNYANKFEEAINHLKQTIAAFPNLYLGHWFLGMAYRCVSKLDESVQEYRKAVELSNEIPFVVAFLSYVLYETGNKEEAERLIKNLENRSGQEYVPAMSFISYYLLRGEHDQALKWVERAIREHDGYLPFMTVYPVKEYRIPNEPRFAGLMKIVGLERYFQKE